MVIVFVIDNFSARVNGTSITAQRYCEGLRKRGHEVRVVSNNISGDGAFSVSERYIPFVTPISKKHSVTFAAADKRVLRKAFEGASVVHFFMPWKLARAGRRIAESMGIPVTAAFHCQPENVTYNLGLKRFGFVADYIYGRFRRRFYKHFDNIHCPSAFIADELKRHKYKSKLHVISNGVSAKFAPREKAARLAEKADGTFSILMIGRLAAEKRQDLLIRAAASCKYSDRIRLIFAGKGPREKALKRMGARLTHAPVFGFYSEDELVELIHNTDLYVHASDVEIEAISCIEAFSCGKVPIIADAKRSATPQFAVDGRSLFKAGDWRDLARKIEYWIEHPAERAEAEELYARRGKMYSLEHSLKKTEEMFMQAIADRKAKVLAQTLPAAKFMRKKIRRRFALRGALERLLYFGIACPLLYAINFIFFGLRIKNKKALRKLKGAVIISNHVHTLDSSMVAMAVFPKKPIFTSLPSNFRLPLAGVFVNSLGAVPVPQSPSECSVFFYELSKRVCEGKFVHFFPEGELIKYCPSLRDFKRGAFYLASLTQAPVVPLAITYREPAGLYKLFKRRPLITVTVCEPVKPDSALLKNDSVNALTRDAFARMSALIPQTESEQEAV